MIAKWATKCGKCGVSIEVGETIKAQFVRVGFDSDTGKPIWQRVPKSYVHAPRCPKVTPNKPGHAPVGVDPLTGEVVVSDSSPIPRHPHQESLL